jgi:hypothetical protein
MDALYLNEGGGRWTKSRQLLPNDRRPAASSVVVARDIDGDGDQDFFVGGRLRPGTYGIPTASYLLLNDGRGTFSATADPQLERLGMVTAAVWLDQPDRLAVATEWGPLFYLQFNDAGRLAQIDTLPAGNGLWHALAAADLDGDGRQDLIAGNHGLNSRLRASPDRPLRLYVNDFDRNGKAEQIVSRYAEDGRAYPFVLRDDLIKQLPGLRKSVAGYADYQGKTMQELFPADILSRSVVREVSELRSLIVYNRQEGPVIEPLPRPAQFAPIYAIAVGQFGGDDRPDLLLAGNQSVGRPEMGIYAADFGTLLIQSGNGAFRVVPPAATGMYLSGDVRGIVQRRPGEWLIARSGGSLLELSIDTP